MGLDRRLPSFNLMRIGVTPQLLAPNAQPGEHRFKGPEA